MPKRDEKPEYPITQILLFITGLQRVLKKKKYTMPKEPNLADSLSTIKYNAWTGVKFLFKLQSDT